MRIQVQQEQNSYYTVYEVQSSNKITNVGERCVSQVTPALRKTLQTYKRQVTRRTDFQWCSTTVVRVEVIYIGLLS